jgi:hypothetical protein
MIGRDAREGRLGAFVLAHPRIRQQVGANL